MVTQDGGRGRWFRWRLWRWVREMPDPFHHRADDRVALLVELIRFHVHHQQFRLVGHRFDTLHHLKGSIIHANRTIRGQQVSRLTCL